MKDYYQILEITSQADKQAIRSAYKRLAFMYHPDKNPDNPVAEEKFKLINEAYQVLSDDEKKEIYDLQFRLYNLKSYQQINPPNTAFQRRNAAYYHERHYNRPRYIREEQLSKIEKIKAWGIATIIILFFGSFIGILGNWQIRKTANERLEEGILLMDEGDWEKADSRFNEVLNLQKNHTGAYLQKALLYADKYHLPKHACYFLDKSIELSEKPSAFMIMKRGICLYKLKDFGAAFTDFARVIDDVDVTDNESFLKTQSHFYLGLSLHKQDAQLHREQICKEWKIAAQHGLKEAADSLQSFCNP
jgi:curved DNA-binding protein CbpA